MAGTRRGCDGRDRGGVPSLGATDAGSWVEPTILTGLSDEAAAFEKRSLDRSATWRFDSEEEVIAAPTTRTTGCALRSGPRIFSALLRAAMDSGWAHPGSYATYAPFGGTGASGIGRMRIHSVNFYRSPKMSASNSTVPDSLPV